MIKQKFGVGDKLKCLKTLSHFNVDDYCIIVNVIKWDNTANSYYYEIISNNGINKIKFRYYDMISTYFDVKSFERRKKLKLLEKYDKSII